MTVPTPNLACAPKVKAFLDPGSHTISYVVQDPASNACAIVDAVMEFDQAAGRLTYDCADAMIAYIQSNNLDLQWIIETHVHADHLSGAPYIQQQLGGQIGIGEHIVTVQDTFGKIFNEGTEFQRDGSQFDRLFRDMDRYQIGTMPCHVLHTPGHTPACNVHIMGDAAFAGDTLFMPDGGSARADFPGGDAGELYDSITRVLSLPDNMRLFVCHDYGPGGREIAWETTIGAERTANIHVGEGQTREDFIAMREARDATLKVPGLIIPSLQVNMRAGTVPTDQDGNMALKIPVNKL
ncbi:MAG: MBL fold metallo-hydrolase [Paracoccaceae bacterium]